LTQDLLITEAPATRWLEQQGGHHDPHRDLTMRTL